MGRGEREKGRKGEAEVAGLFALEGLTVRGLESAGDHLVVCGPAGGLTVHSEVKRQETARPWLWWAQASSEAPPGTIAAVTFRRNRSPWLTMLDAHDFARLLRLSSTVHPLDELLELGNEMADELEQNVGPSGTVPAHVRPLLERWDELSGRGRPGEPA